MRRWQGLYIDMGESTQAVTTISQELAPCCGAISSHKCKMTISDSRKPSAGSCVKWLALLPTHPEPEGLACLEAGYYYALKEALKCYSCTVN